MPSNSLVDGQATLSWNTSKNRSRNSHWECQWKCERCRSFVTSASLLSRPIPYFIKPGNTRIWHDGLVDTWREQKWKTASFSAQRDWRRGDHLLRNLVYPNLFISSILSFSVLSTCVERARTDLDGLCFWVQTISLNYMDYVGVQCLSKEVLDKLESSLVLDATYIKDCLVW